VTALTDDCTTYELVVHWLFAFSASEAELGPQHVRHSLRIIRRTVDGKLPPPTVLGRFT